jgi:Flp pilus assembly protein TadG
MTHLPHKLGARFWRHSHGSMTVYGLYLFMLILMVAGLAIDTASVNLAKTKLQATADATAHAALYNRERNSREVAKYRALRVAQDWMPRETFGNIVDPTDIEFGIWDHATATFTPNPWSKSAVRVTTHMDAAHNNGLRALLLRVTGSDNLFDVRAQSIFTTFIPNCLREGFVAQGVVDIQSNNGFAAGFCVHSNDHVALNNNNTFAPGTVVSMPDLSAIDLGRNGFERNEGLEAALRSGAYRLRTLNNAETIMDGLDAADPDYLPDYIRSTLPINIWSHSLTEADFTPGRIHRIACRGRQITISTSAPLTDVVILTDCPIRFGQGSTLENAIVATTDDSDRSITGPSGLNIGRDDDCDPDGGATLITNGGMNFAADLAMFGGRLISGGDISFAARADGIEGASIIAGGKVDGTSNSYMGFCGQGMEAKYEAQYFRMAL